MKWIPIKTYKVKSSNIKKMGYDPGASTMQIDFCSGASYQYCPVTLVEFQSLYEADSIGKKFHETIKTNPSINYLKKPE